MTVWEVNKKVTDDHLVDFTSAMLNIFTQLRSLDSKPSQLIVASRPVSVELRMLLIDGLLRMCLQKPRLHPLLHPNRLKGDPFESTFEVSNSTPYRAEIR